MKPRVCVLKTAGTNCDQETVYAFQKAGAEVQTILIDALRLNQSILNDHQILVIPGGFSYGDDIISGKVFALELLCLQEMLERFIARAETLIIGICNGFQVLVRTGLLPFKTLGTMQTTLISNDSGKFECRWIEMHVQESSCIFTKGLQNKKITLPVAHAEGKFFTDKKNLDEIENNNLVVLRYSLPNEYPANPNGSLNGIAGICDSTGRIFGLMPHPERFIELYQHPNWRKETFENLYGLSLFKNAVQSVAQW